MVESAIGLILVFVAAVITLAPLLSIQMFPPWPLALAMFAKVSVIVPAGVHSKLLVASKSKLPSFATVTAARLAAWKVLLPSKTPPPVSLVATPPGRYSV